MPSGDYMSISFWTDVDRWLRHWQMIGALGRPEEWRPLAHTDENIPEMLRRIDLVGRHGTFPGTGQHHDMLALAAALRDSVAAKTSPPTEPEAEGPPDAEEEIVPGDDELT